MPKLTDKQRLARDATRDLNAELLAAATDLARGRIGRARGVRIQACTAKTRSPMSELEIIESQVARLDDKAFAAFRAWFVEYENMRWDKQIETDSKAGKLDSLISEAVAEYQVGKSTPL